MKETVEEHRGGRDRKKKVIPDYILYQFILSFCAMLYL